MKEINKYLQILTFLAGLLLLTACGTSEDNNDLVKERALDYLATYAQSGIAVPNVQDYEDAGVLGVTTNNVSELNAILLGLNYEDVDTTQEIQAILDEIAALAPIITLIGSNVTLEIGSTYSDLGATASDSVDGDITANITTISTVDTNTLGTYTVTYNVNDSSNNAAIQVTRTVTVVDTTSPIITLNGDVDISIVLDESYVELGATALDNKDGNLTANISIDNALVDTSTLGAYLVTYTISDVAGNTAELNRTITVIARFSRDDSLEVVTDYLTGRMWQDDEDAKTIEKNWQKSIDYCLAMDFGGYTDWVLPEKDVLNNIVDSNKAYDVIVSIFTHVEEDFYWTSTEHSISGEAWDIDFADGLNSGDTKSNVLYVRCVRDIVDITAPVITLNGDANISVILDEAYAELGATALDEKDDNVTDDISIDDTLVDTSTVGAYTVIYTVSDTAGNMAEANRTVSVIDSITHNQITYGFMTSPHTGKIWLDRNLGASQVCTAFDDRDCYGDYYQWGRNADGHEDSTSNTNSILVDDVDNLNNVGHGEFILSTAFADWASVDTNDAPIRLANWSKTDGSSVCPVGFRVPNSTELTSETLDKGVQDFSNFLKLPFAGIRFYQNGSFINVDNTGLLWSSQGQGLNSIGISFTSSSAETVGLQRAFGTSVRCIQD